METALETASGSFQSFPFWRGNSIVLWSNIFLSTWAPQKTLCWVFLQLSNNSTLKWEGTWVWQNRVWYYKQVTYLHQELGVCLAWSRLLTKWHAEDSGAPVRSLVLLAFANSAFTNKSDVCIDKCYLGSERKKKNQQTENSISFVSVSTCTSSFLRYRPLRELQSVAVLGKDSAEQWHDE